MGLRPLGQRDVAAVRRPLVLSDLVEHFYPTQRAPFLKFPNQLQHQQIPESIIPQSITTPANSRINYNN